jgi:hypothetical protein
LKLKRQLLLRPTKLISVMSCARHLKLNS